MSTAIVKKAAIDLTLLAVIVPHEGQITEDQIVPRKEYGMGNELGHVPLQGVRALVKVNMNEDGTGTRSSGYRLLFDKHHKNGYMSADEALNLGCIQPVGKTADGKVVYEWVASELGFQPNTDATKRGQWITA